MAVYNLNTAEGRERLRGDRQAELVAVHEGRWPRDANDRLRWHAPAYRVHGRFWTEAEWAARMCQIDLDYLALREERSRFLGSLAADRRLTA